MENGWRRARTRLCVAKFLPTSGFGAGQSQLRVFELSGAPIVVEWVTVQNGADAASLWQVDVIVSRNRDLTLELEGADASVFDQVRFGDALTAADTPTGVRVSLDQGLIRLGRAFGSGYTGLKVRAFTVGGGVAVAQIQAVVRVDELELDGAGVAGGESGAAAAGSG